MCTMVTSGGRSAIGRMAACRSALLRLGKGHPGNPRRRPACDDSLGHSPLAVGVQRLPLDVEALGVLAHDQQIDARSAGFNRRRDHRPQVGVEIQRPAHGDDGAAVAFHPLARRTDGAEECAVAGAQSGQRFVRQCCPLALKSIPARGQFHKINPVRFQRQSRLHHSGGGRHNLEADAVARNQADSQPARFVFLIHINTLNRAYSPKAPMTTPAIRLIQRMAAGPMRLRKSETPPLNSSHQSADPQKTPATISMAVPIVVLVGRQPEPGKDGHKRQDRDRVGQRQHKGREIGCRQASATGAGGLIGRRRKKGAHGQIAEKETADNAQPELMLDQKGRDQHQPKGGDAAVDGVGRGSAQAGDQPGHAPVVQRALDAEQTDGSHRRGDGEADAQPPSEQPDVHRLPCPRCDAHARAIRFDAPCAGR